MSEKLSNHVVVIMAGGLGKRMKTDLPKVLHQINGKPMLAKIILESIKIKPKKILIVVGKYRPIIESTMEQHVDSQLLNTYVKNIDQKEALGTGNAIQSCYSEFLNYIQDNVLILSGDVPLIQSKTMLEMLKNVKKIRLMVTELENPTGYGRIVEFVERNQTKFDKIVEEKDCNERQKSIRKINCGIYSFQISILHKYIYFIRNNNSQKEYYLTDIFEIVKNGEYVDIEMLEIPKEQQKEIMGVNTPEQLKELEKMEQLGTTFDSFMYQKDPDHSTNHAPI